ncbi:MAG: response regulator transcription factor [Rhodanobacteraceae bacterium]|nr:response regulator transcription factor [Xanthomonadales bacterium]MCP5478663.1 response regulator transcription factor [Rhodanobacteraceae bacterium]
MDNSEESRGRVAIVEDDPVVREHLIDIISAAPRLDLAGVAPSVERGRALIAQCPDLFLLDIGLPDGNGLDLAREIKQQLDCRVLILTSFGDRRTVLMAVDAGADGYLLKDSSADFIRDGIEATLDGGSPVSPAAAVYLMERLRGGGSLPPEHETLDDDPSVPASTRLTPREAELLTLFARGISYKQAARELDISPLTVGNHVKSIYRKLAVHSRGEAVYAAIQSGELKV